MNYKELTQNVIDGEESPFKALSILKQIENDVKECIKEINPIAIEESEKYDKTFELHGLKIERVSGRKVWNFKNIEEWKKHDEAKKDCEEKYKAVYHSYEKNVLSAEKETGEEVQLPEVTYTSDYLKIKEI